MFVGFNRPFSVSNVLAMPTTGFYVTILLPRAKDGVEKGVSILECPDLHLRSPSDALTLLPLDDLSTPIPSYFVWILVL